MRIPSQNTTSVCFFLGAMQSPLFIVSDESDTDGTIIRLTARASSSFVRTIASGPRYLCAPRTEWINERRGNEGEKFIRVPTDVDGTDLLGLGTVWPWSTNNGVYSGGSNQPRNWSIFVAKVDPPDTTTRALRIFKWIHDGVCVKVSWAPSWVVHLQPLKSYTVLFKGN